METVWEETLLGRRRRRRRRKINVWRKPDMTCVNYNYRVANFATPRTDWL
jgi:hypothetical protein